MAALVIKIVAGTCCLLDGPAVVSLADARGSTAVMQAVDDVGAEADACVLGEAGGCHCACAHAVSMPSTAPVLNALLTLPQVDRGMPAAPALHPTGSQFRPPIA